MSLLNYNEVLTAATIDGQRVVSNQGPDPLAYNNRVVLPNHFLKVGRTLRITATGVMDLNFNSGGNCQFSLNLGTIGNVNVFNFTSGIPINTYASGPKYGLPFRLTGIMTVRAVGTGTSSNFYGIWQITSQALQTSPEPSAGGVLSGLFPGGATAVSSGFDFTVANLVLLSFSFGAGSNQLVINQYVLEALN